MPTTYSTPVTNLLRIDGCPLQEDKLSFALISWLAVLADTLNSTFDLIEQNINTLNTYASAEGFAVPKLTAAQIIDLGVTPPNGWLCYDTVNNVYVGKASEALVKFTTSPYP